MNNVLYTRALQATIRDDKQALFIALQDDGALFKALQANDINLTFSCVKHGSVESLKLLIGLGFKLPENSIAHAAYFGSLDIVRLLFDLDVDELKLLDVGTALSSGNLEIFTFLFELFAKAAGTQEPQRRSHEMLALLSLAAFKGYIDICNLIVSTNLIIDYNCEIPTDTQIDISNTAILPPLIAGCESKFPEIVHLFINLGIVLSTEAAQKYASLLKTCLTPQIYNDSSQVKVSFDNMNLAGWSVEWVSDYRNLTELKLSNNKFECLPAELFCINTLKQLDVRHNPLLATLGIEKPWRCNALQKFDASHCRLQNIPDQFQVATSLNKLTLHRNVLTARSFFSWNCKLQKLDLSRNRSLGNLIISANSIWTISLTDLNLSDCQLIEVPESLYNLVALTHLNLSNNLLVKFTETDQYKWRCHFLQSLNLSCNKLGQKPTCTSSPIPFIGSSSGAESCSGVSFSERWSSFLQSLDLSRNEFTELPNGVCDLTNLQILDLSHNPGLRSLDCFSTKRQIKTTISVLRNLRILRAKGLTLDGFPKALLRPGHTTKEILHHLKMLSHDQQQYFGIKTLLFSTDTLCGGQLLKTLNAKEIFPCEEAASQIDNTSKNSSASMFVRRYAGSASFQLEPGFLKKIDLRIWSVPASCLYYHFYRLLFTPNCLSIVVWDVTEDTDCLLSLLTSLRDFVKKGSALILLTCPETASPAVMHGNFIYMEEKIHAIFKDVDWINFLIVKCFTQPVNFADIAQHIYQVVMCSPMKTIGGGHIIGRSISKDNLKLHDLVWSEGRKTLPLIEEAECFFQEHFPSTIPDIQTLAEIGTVLSTDFSQSAVLMFDPSLPLRVLDATFSIAQLGTIYIREEIDKVFAASGLRPYSSKLLQWFDTYGILCQCSHYSNVKLICAPLFPLGASTPLWAFRSDDMSSSVILGRTFQLNRIACNLWASLVTVIEAVIPKLKANWHCWSQIFPMGVEYGETKHELSNSTLWFKHRGMQLYLEIGTHTRELTLLWSCTRDEHNFYHRLFSFVVDQIEHLFSDRYNEFCSFSVSDLEAIALKRLALCTHCLLICKSLYLVYKFEISSCLAAIARGQHVMKCGSCEQSVSLDDLLPDYRLLDIGSEMCLDSKELSVEVTPDSELGAGGVGGVYVAKYKGEEVAFKLFATGQRIIDSFSEISDVRHSAASRDSVFASSESAEGSSFTGTYHSQSSNEELGMGPDFHIFHDQLMESFSSLRQELAILAHLQHPNLIQFLGYSIRPFFGFAMEIAPFGSLRSVLSQTLAVSASIASQPPSYRHNECADSIGTYPILGRELTCKIILEVASALDYMHHLDIVNGDVKSDNVLIYSMNYHDKVNAKLSDYGVTRFVVSQGIQSNVGTPGYQAPEVTKGNPYNVKADIYSYGKLLYELRAGSRPLSNLQSSADRQSATELNIDDIEDFVIIQNLSQNQLPEMQKLMSKCTQINPSDRPTAYEICSYVRQAQFLAHFFDGEVPIPPEATKKSVVFASGYKRQASSISPVYWVLSYYCGKSAYFLQTTVTSLSKTSTHCRVDFSKWPYDKEEKITHMCFLKDLLIVSSFISDSNKVSGSTFDSFLRLYLIKKDKFQKMYTKRLGATYVEGLCGSFSQMSAATIELTLYVIERSSKLHQLTHELVYQHDGVICSTIKDEIHTFANKASLFDVTCAALDSYIVIVAKAEMYCLPIKTGDRSSLSLRDPIALESDATILETLSSTSLLLSLHHRKQVQIVDFSQENIQFGTKLYFDYRLVSDCNLSPIAVSVNTRTPATAYTDRIEEFHSDAIAASPDESPEDQDEGISVGFTEELHSPALDQSREFVAPVCSVEKDLAGNAIQKLEELGIENTPLSQKLEELSIDVPSFVSPLGRRHCMKGRSSKQMADLTSQSPVELSTAVTVALPVRDQIWFGLSDGRIVLREMDSGDVVVTFSGSKDEVCALYLIKDDLICSVHENSDSYYTYFIWKY